MAKATTYTDVKLEDCFSCGSSLGPFFSAPDRQVICSTCGARGAYARKDLTAEELWNIVCQYGA